MRLKDLEVIVVGNPPPGFGGKYFTFVKLITSCGLVGWGEVYAASVGPKAMGAVIQDIFKRHIFGEDPVNIEFMYRKVYSSGFSQRPDPTILGAFSGIEIACWDILGKSRNLPIWKMLGGKVRDRVRSYTYLYPDKTEDADYFYSSPQRAVEAAKKCVEMGFTAIKFDPAGPYTIYGGHQPSLKNIEVSETFCMMIRDAIGPQADILFGTHGQFTPAGAIRLAKRLEQFDPLWFEEPIPPDNFYDMSKVAKSTSIPIATGERLTSKSEFTYILRSNSASILQPALGRVGGLWEAKKISIIGESFSAQIAPHLYAGPIEWAANIQLAISTPNFLILETIGTGEGFQKELLLGEICWENGYVIPPHGPGLGVELNEKLARSHPYKGEKLHLEMQLDQVDDTPGDNFSGHQNM